MKTTISLLILFFVFTACNENLVYKKHKDLSPNLQWNRSDEIEFEVPIEDKASTYNLILALRYAQGFQYKTALIKVRETSPSGKILNKQYKLNVKDDNGEFIGEPAFDIWDLEQVVEINKKYAEIGTYTYVLEHAMIRDPLHYAMEVGVIVERSVGEDE